MSEGGSKLCHKAGWSQQTVVMIGYSDDPDLEAAGLEPAYRHRLSSDFSCGRKWTDSRTLASSDLDKSIAALVFSA